MLAPIFHVSRNAHFAQTATPMTGKCCATSSIKCPCPTPFPPLQSEVRAANGRQRGRRPRGKTVARRATAEAADAPEALHPVSLPNPAAENTCAQRRGPRGAVYFRTPFGRVSPGPLAAGGVVPGGGPGRTHASGGCSSSGGSACGPRGASSSLRLGLRRGLRACGATGPKGGRACAPHAGQHSTGDARRTARHSAPPLHPS